MNSITPYILTKGDEANLLASDGYKVEQSGGFNIVYKDILADTSIDADELTNELRCSFETLGNVDGKIYEPHVLVREAVRGNLVDGTPCGYVVELTQDGPIVHALDQMDSVPLLVGYGSLLDPAELACNTEEGDLRNLLDFEAKSALAEEKGIIEKISYAEISGLELRFDRVPTLERYGHTQEERNFFTVLNSEPKKGANAPVVIFDPADLTENPLDYFAHENYDETEYARRRIEPEQIKIFGDSKLSLDKGVWVLDSPLITDVEGDLEVIIPNPSAKISERYMHMITNGLAGAEQAVPGFAKKYVESVIQANGQPLSENDEFIEVLEQKLPVGTLSYFGKNPIPDRASSGHFEA